MQASGVIVHSNQLSRLGVNHQILRNGSSVLVRVIGERGNGQYTGSVAGVRVNLKSNQQLKIGSTFVASITQKDGTIYISPKDTFVKAESFNLKTLNNEQIIDFIKNLGVPLDQISLNLIKQFKQMELKFDSTLLNKLHNIAVKYKGKEKAFSEILSVLIKKGIDIDENEINQLLSILNENPDSDDKEYAQGYDLLRKINKKEGSWFLFPFEMIDLSSNAILGKGNIKLFYNDPGELKILNLDCNVWGKRYLFNINFEKNHISKLRFNAGDNEIEELLELLQKKYPRLKIEWSEISDIEGTACAFEEFIAYEGEV